jgi:hypothetical protein
MSLVPIISQDFSRPNARGRSNLHSPKEALTSQTHSNPDQRGTNAALSRCSEIGPRAEQLARRDFDPEAGRPKKKETSSFARGIGLESYRKAVPPAQQAELSGNGAPQAHKHRSIPMPAGTWGREVGREINRRRPSVGERVVGPFLHAF